MAQPAETDSATQDKSGAPASLGAPDFVLGNILAFLNFVGTSIILLLALLVNVEIISRKIQQIPGANEVFASVQNFLLSDVYMRFGPIQGSFELQEVSIVVIVFLQLGYATRAGKMVRSDGLLSVAHNRLPMVGHTMSAIFDALGAAFLAVVFFGTLPDFLRAFANPDDYWTGREGLFQLVDWPVKLCILIGSAATSLQFAFFTIGHIKALMNRS